MITNLHAGFVQVNQAQVARPNICVMAPLSKPAWERSACDLSPELLAEMTRVDPMSKVAGVANAPSSIGRRIRVVSSDRSGSRVTLAEIFTRATVLLPLPQPSRLFRLEKCEPTMTPLIMTYLSIAGMLAFTTFPVPVPAIITAGHAILSWISEILASRVQGRAVVDVTH